MVSREDSKSRVSCNRCRDLSRTGRLLLPTWPTHVKCKVCPLQNREATSRFSFYYFMPLTHYVTGQRVRREDGKSPSYRHKATGLEREGHGSPCKGRRRYEVRGKVSTSLGTGGKATPTPRYLASRSPRRLAPPGSPAPSAVAAPASASPPSLLMCQLLGGVLGGTLG